MYNEAQIQAAQTIYGSATSFGELQVAGSTTIIDLKSTYGVTALRDKTDESTGTGTVSNANGRYTLSTGATASSSAVLESVERGRYVAGFDGVPGIGIRLPALPVGEQEARWGYYDANDGFGVGIDATGLFSFIRNGGTETITRKEDWRCSLDTLEITNTNVFRFPFRWYGSGPVVYEVTTPNTQLYPGLTRFHYVNADPGDALVQNPNLPLRAEVINQGTASDFTLEVFGRQFAIKGNYNPNRRFTSEHRLSQSVGTSFTPLVTFRQKPAFEAISVKAGGIALSVASANIIYQLRIDPSLTGASFAAPSDIPASETALEFDKSATALTGGQKIFEGVAVAGAGSFAGGAEQDLPNVDLPVNQPITLCARSVSGTATVTSVLRAREEW